MSNQSPVVPVVKVVNNKPITTSLNVAEVFGKPHKDVLRAIENLEIPDDLRERNFAPTSNRAPMPNGGFRDVPLYTLTRDGFTILVMGFTGPKAMKFKLAYIEAFNRMEAELSAKALPPPKEPAFTLVDSVPQGTKRCTRCRVPKPLAEFSRRIANKDGYEIYCIPCNKLNQQEYRQRNRERNLAVRQPVKPEPAEQTVSLEAYQALHRSTHDLQSSVVDLLEADVAIASDIAGLHSGIIEIISDLSRGKEATDKLAAQGNSLRDLCSRLMDHAMRCTKTATALGKVLYGPSPTQPHQIEGNTPRQLAAH